MENVVFELLGYILDNAMTDPEIFLSQEKECIAVEFSDTSLIMRMILPLCNSGGYDFLEKYNDCTARVVFLEDQISCIVLESYLGQCFQSDVGEKLICKLADMGHDDIYMNICAHVIKYISIILTSQV